MNVNAPLCPHCQKPVRPGARFCASCGSPIAPAVAPIPAVQAVQARPVVSKPPRQKKSRLWLWVILLLVLCIMTVACLVAAYFLVPGFREMLPFSSNTAPTATESAIIKTTETPEVTDTPAPDDQILTPEATLAPPTAEPVEGYFFTYNKIEFIIPVGIASDASGVTLDAITDGMTWEIMPGYDSCVFNDYRVANSFHKPVINIYPVDEYIALIPDVETRITDLKTLLANPVEEPLSIPFLPYWNAGPLFTTRVEYLDFQNGSGVRYLTQYGQSFWPINNYDMFYSFQGITDDDKYYISAVFPVTHPMLPPTGNDYKGSMDEMANDFEAYLDTILPDLNTWASAEFIPNLDEFDQMIKSLKVN